MQQPLPGIDVSHWQGNIDWDRLFRAGVIFAYIKASEGNAYKDPEFDFNWASAKRVGIKRGAYHYVRARIPVQAQIDNFVRSVGELQPGDLPPALDVEEHDQWLHLTMRQRADIVVAWMEGVKSRLGIAPIIYSSPSIIHDVMGSDARFAAYLLWVAHWTAASNPIVPSPWTNWTFWQYSSHGSVDGIAGRVDVNRFNGTLEDLLRISVPPPTCIESRILHGLRKLRFGSLLAGELPARWADLAIEESVAQSIGHGSAGSSFASS